MERAARVMERGLQLMLGFAAGFILILGVGLMFVIGGGRAHLAGRLSVALIALVSLVGVDTLAMRLAQRRRPLLAPDPPGYRRFVVGSAIGLLVAAAVLLGIAWFLGGPIR